MVATLRKNYRAFLLSQAFLNRLSITSFPLNPFSVLAPVKAAYNLNVILVTDQEYATFCKLKGVQHKPIRDGRCIWDVTRDLYLVIINDQLSAERKRFTVLHELGHILLGHLEDDRTELDRGGLGLRRYYFFEGETNTFAGNVLAPPILVHEFLRGGSFCKNSVRLRFMLSALATERRKQDYEEWLCIPTTVGERDLLQRCGMLFRTNFCPLCSHKFYQSDAKFCPICGNEGFLVSEAWHNMEYSRIELDENSKAFVCPLCGNTVIRNGDYCSVCGSCLVNRCTSTSWDINGNILAECNNHLTGEARYCSVCGSESTFLRNGFLRPWQKERESETSVETEPYAIRERNNDENFPY